MGISVVLFWILLAAVGAGRLLEMRLSKRNQELLTALGSERVAEPHFRWMVALHAGVLLGAALEVPLLHRPLIRWLAISAGAGFLLANALRWWAIRTLSASWNIQVMTPVGQGFVTGGPYRWIRHPNYLAVFLELLSLPLIHTAWLTTTVGSAAHIWVLRKRLAIEEKILDSSPAYRTLMRPKPRFIPWLF